VRNHLGVDADLVHVRKSLARQPFGGLLVRREVPKERSEPGVGRDGRRVRQLKDAGHGLRMLKVLFDGDDAQPNSLTLRQVTGGA
jgi:hypothetical protein